MHLQLIEYIVQILHIYENINALQCLGVHCHIDSFYNYLSEIANQVHNCEGISHLNPSNKRSAYYCVHLNG